MVIDTSALAAVVFGEDDAEVHLRAMVEHAGDNAVSAATLVEATIVVEARQGPEAASDLTLLLQQTGCAAHAVTADHADLAVAAWRRFGKARHGAALNLGDCFSYALARSLEQPLLFKGDDFRQTDITAAT